jgi:hypothetical protein
MATVDIGDQDNRFAEACASMVAPDENARSPAASGGRVEGAAPAEDAGTSALPGSGWHSQHVRDADLSNASA